MDIDVSKLDSVTFGTLVLLELVHGEEGRSAGEGLMAEGGGVLVVLSPLVVVLGVVCITNLSIIGSSKPLPRLVTNRNRTS
jgi:hypothetical protein